MTFDDVLRFVQGESYDRIDNSGVKHVQTYPNMFQRAGNAVQSGFNSIIRNLGKKEPVQAPVQQVAPIRQTPAVVQPTVQPEVRGIAYTNAGRTDRAQNTPINQDLINTITNAAKAFNVPASLMFDIAAQESSFNPKSDPWNEGRGQQYADAGYPKGLYQLTDPLWSSLTEGTGDFGKSLRPMLKNVDRFDPETNALAAAYLISHGQLGRWNASQGVWGPGYTYEEILPFYNQTLGDRIPSTGWKVLNGM